MSFCDNCARNVWDKPELPFPPECIECQDIDGKASHFLPKPMTNADRIRAMSDEELARHLHCIGWDCHLCAEHRRLDNEPLLRDQRCDENCFEHCLEWLKQPAEVDHA